MIYRLHACICMLFLCAAVAGCGGGATGDSTKASALQGAEPGDVMDHVRKHLQARATRSPGVGPQMGLVDGVIADTMTVSSASKSMSSSGAITTGQADPVRSGTTVQEADVDEDDFLKASAQAIYALRFGDFDSQLATAGQLLVHRFGLDDQVEKPIVLDLPSSGHGSLRGMYLAENPDRIVVLSERHEFWPVFAPSISVDCLSDPPCPVSMPSRRMFWPSKAKTDLQLVDSPSIGPELRERIEIDGRLVSSRLIGNHLYLTLSHTPRFPTVDIPWNASTEQWDQALDALEITDVLPSIRIDGGAPQLLVKETECHLQTANRSPELEVTTIVAFDIRAERPTWRSSCFVGGTQAIYMTAGSLYLATSRYGELDDEGRWIYGSSARTDIHKFSIDSGKISYRGSADVIGHLGWDRDRAAYRMSEYAGHLRVVTYSGDANPANGSGSPSPATLTILHEGQTDGRLDVLSTLPNEKRPEALGLAGEQVYAVRFQQERAYVVTFRQTDPLYVLDLSDPSDPKAVGELKMPGYSDYLYPIPNGLLLGVGKDATSEGRIGGVKFSLFDVTNPMAPTELAVIVHGETGSVSALDYSSRGINLFRRDTAVRVSIPLGLYGPAWTDFQQGLQLLEVDTVSRTLKNRRWIPSSDPTRMDLWSDRSLQIEDRVFHWSQGKLGVHAW